MRNIVESKTSRVIATGIAGGLFAAELTLAMGLPLLNSLSVRPYEVKGNPAMLDCANGSGWVEFATGLENGETVGLSGIDLFVAPLDPLVTVQGAGEGKLNVRVRDTAQFIDASVLDGQNIKGVNFTKNGFSFSESGKMYDASYNPSIQEVGQTSFRLVMGCITS